MTYGEYLRFCRITAKVDTKSEFSRQLGFIDPDHYIGAENDRGGKKPSLDLLERAARLAKFEFYDFIQEPKGASTPRSRANAKLHRMLDDLLNLEGEDAEETAQWFSVSIQTFHRDYFSRKR